MGYCMDLHYVPERFRLSGAGGAHDHQHKTGIEHHRMGVEKRGIDENKGVYPSSSQRERFR